MPCHRTALARRQAIPRVRYVTLVHTYTLDRERYGLPADPDDPAYAAEKWPLSKCLLHCREASKTFGAHVANLFAVALPGATDPVEGLLGQLGVIAAGGYLTSVIDAFGDFDVVDSFKRMAADGKLRRMSAAGVVQVYEDSPAGKAASTNTVDGLEMYYAGRPELIVQLWWAMLCENCAPFASLHDRIAAVLQPKSPARS